MKISGTVRSKLKEAGWAAYFFLALALFTFPAILLSKAYGFEITLFHQMIIVVAANVVSQLTYRSPLTAVTGKPDSHSFRNLLVGLAMGSVLMLAPSLFLFVGNWVIWNFQPVTAQPFLIAIASVLAGAITEEFLFRGFLFQRLLSFGVWPAQLIISAYFLLTHMGNPQMDMEVKALAMTNIFLASVLFGMTVIHTKGLMMAIALHASANLVQGSLLGFGVSGHAEQSLSHAVIGNAPQWLTGGQFGLEGSLPGLMALIVLMLIFQKVKNATADSLKQYK